MDRQLRIIQLAERAMELPDAEQRTFVHDQCEEDERLREEVFALLAATGQASELFPTEPNAPRVAASRIQCGEILLNRYVVKGMLGAGGMGEVYRATDRELDRDVAIKLLNRASSESPELNQRFRREVKSVAAFSHPNVMQIFDVTTWNGMPFAVLELIEGQTLRKKLAAGKLDWRSAAKVARDVASGLEAAHVRGVMHRDIKPENIMILGQGNAKILDFGLAKPVELGETQELTMDAVLPGTIPYMSPEQAEGKELTSTTDVFSLGTVLFECLSGFNPFRGDTAVATLHLVAAARPPTFPRLVPAALAKLNLQMLTREPSRRISAGECVRQLDAILNADDKTIEAGEIGPEFNSTASQSTTPNNLAGRHIALVGRDDEIAEIKSCLDQHQVVTVVAAGGMGKTSLAIQVARETLDVFIGGVWFCDFTSIDRSTDVLQIVAGAVDGAGTNDELGEIVDRLSEQRTLLVFDNCEHLIDAVADLADTLVRRVSGLSVLATSREALAIPGECVRELHCLQHTGEGNDASRLFVQRVKSLTGMNIDPAKSTVVSRIVSRLEGVPLAIELAAPRVRSMSLEDLLLELDDQLTALSISRRGNQRQSRLDRTIQWSYELLSQEERELLLDLAVFAAPFTSDAAITVSASGRSGNQRLRRLVEQSVILRSDHRGHVRYRLLQPYRQFCLQQIDPEQLADVRQRHACYFAKRAQRLGQGIYGEDEIETVKALNCEWADLRSAIAWGRENNNPSIAIDPVVSLARTIIYHARTEAFGWLQDALTVFPDQLQSRADVHWFAAAGLWMKGETEAAYHRLDTADSIRKTPQSLWIRYILLFGDNRFLDAIDAVEEARRLARKLGDEVEQRWLTQPYRAVPLLMMNPNDPRVDDCANASEVFLAKLDWPSAHAYLQMVNGTVAMARKDLTKAAECMSKSVKLARSCGNRGMEMLAGLMSNGFSNPSATPAERLDSAVQHLRFLIATGGHSHFPLAVRSVVSSLIACGHIRDGVRCSAIVSCLQGVGDEDELSPGFSAMLSQLRQHHGTEFEKWLSGGNGITIGEIVAVAEQYL